MKNSDLSFPVGQVITYRLLLVYCFLIVFASCSETPTALNAVPDEPKRAVDDYYILKDQPLDTIRHYISGKWQLHYSYGGITGHIRIDHRDSFIDFGSGDSVLRTRDGVLYEQTPITWIRVVDLLGDSAYIIKPYGWGVWGIRNDTLELYDNSPDGMGHFLTRADDRFYPLN